MKKLLLNLTSFALLSAFLIGCAEEGIKTEKYNALVRKHNSLVSRHNTLVREKSSLVTDAFNVSTASKSELDHQFELDNSVQHFNSTIEWFQNRFPKGTTVTLSSLKTLTTSRDHSLKTIAKLEASILKQLGALEEGVDHVYYLPYSARAKFNAIKRNFEARNKQLVGIRNLMNKHLDVVLSHYKLPASFNRRIILKPEETVIASSTGSGVARDSQGKTVILKTQRDIENFAKNNGYDTTAATHGYTMSSRTGGRVGFSRSAEQIHQSINDMIAHMKGQMNLNASDLELVFLIDESGSMQNDIKGVTDGLVKITSSLEAITRAGRKVKVSIVTFGAPHMRTVELNLTENMATVRNKLTSIYQNFTGNNSTNPGEASYHGLETAVTGVNWSSRNRMIIAITDEPAQELDAGVGDPAYVRKVEAMLKRNGIQARIYTIITK